MSLKLFRLSLFQLSGILGVGIFYLPYLFYHSNLYFALGGLLTAMYLTYKVNTSYIKIITRYPTTHQLSGYANLLLGPRAKSLAALNMFILSIGALIALTQMTERFLSYVFPYFPPIFLTILMIIFLVVFSFIKTKFLVNFFQILPIIFIVVPLILLQSSFGFTLFPKLDNSNFNLDFFGWTMFALSGFTVLPELWTMLNKKINAIKLLRKASFLGLILASLIYAIFIITIIALSGPRLSPDSVSGLLESHPTLATLVAVFGILTTLKASLNFLEIVHDISFYDLTLDKKTASIMPAIFLVLSVLLAKTDLVQYFHPLATISVFVSICLIFAMRLRLGPTPVHKKIIMLVITSLFLYSTTRAIF